VHKVLKRPILTWVTFPLWIVLFSVLTYSLAASGRPAIEKYNRLYLIDDDNTTGIARFSTWECLYSPNDQYSDNLSSSGFDSMSNHYSWFGLPGSGLGGMAPKTVSPTIWQAGAKQDSYAHITGVPIQVRSTKSFFGQDYSHLTRGNGFNARLSDEEGIPVGTIDISPSDTGADFTLQNCILVYGRWVLELGEIQPGQTLKITKTTPRRDLRDLLIPPKTRENESLRGFTTYNPQSTDLEYIVRVMSLHRALGGYESTGLHHAYQPSLDMSELLTVDRALLLGVTVSPPSDRHRQTLIVRQSFPITLTERSLRWRGERYDPKSGDALDENMRPKNIQPGFINSPAQ